MRIATSTPVVVGSLHRTATFTLRVISSLFTEEVSR
jgi:hypothetical protein